MHHARGDGERSGGDRVAKVSNMKKLLAVAPPKTNLGGGVSASASLGNNALEDRSAPASAGDIPASMGNISAGRPRLKRISC